MPRQRKGVRIELGQPTSVRFPVEIEKTIKAISNRDGVIYSSLLRQFLVLGIEYYEKLREERYKLLAETVNSREVKF